MTEQTRQKEGEKRGRSPGEPNLFGEDTHQAGSAAIDRSGVCVCACVWDPDVMKAGYLWVGFFPWAFALGVESLPLVVCSTFLWVNFVLAGWLGCVHVGGVSVGPT